MSDVSSTSSGMTGAGGGNLLRLTGMNTGLDVDAVVKKMMAAEQTKLDKAKQEQQLLQWRQEAYQDIIKDIKDLQNSFFDSMSSDKNILSSTNFTPFSVAGVGGAAVDTSVATFTPGVGAQTGTYKIEVASLAKGATVNKSLAAGTTLSTKLNTLGVTDASIQLSLTAGATNINISLDNSSGNLTVQDLVNEINNKGGSSVKASFSELTGEFKLTTTATGTSSQLTINAASSDSLSNVLGTYTEGTAINGSNASVTITPPGGTGTTVSKTTNNFTIDGMNYTISSQGTATVSVGSDTEKVYDKIKGFIDKYNAIVDKIQTKLTEKKNYDYKPLTDTQKESMSDSQITAWETKAKTGILRNDSNLKNMLNDLRSAFTTGVSNAGLELGKYGSNSIGIDMSSEISTPGHVEITDANKLKAAISSKTDQILKMFTNQSTTTLPTGQAYDATSTKYKEDGIFTRIKNIFQTNVGYTGTTLNSAILTSYANKQYDYSITGTSGKGTLPDQIYKQQIMVTKITNAMSDKQERYYLQFSRLETAMNTLNAQQSQLSSMLGG